MSPVERNGLRSYLIGVGISVTVPAMLQIGLLIYWISETRIRLHHLESVVEVCCEPNYAPKGAANNK